MVVPRLQQRGSSRLMLTALRDNARRLGFVDLYAPLRPTDKHREPLTPFADYVARRREDGLPYDSWVRTHVRAGAQIVKVAPRSMVIAGTIAEWSRWIPALASPRAARRSCLAPSRQFMSRSSKTMRSMSSRIYGFTTGSFEPRLLRLAAASIRRVLTG